MPKYESIEAHAAQCPELRPRAAQAWLELLRTGSDLLAVYDEMLRGYGLSQGRFTVLMLLSCDGEEGALPSAIADRGGLSRAAVTGIIDALESDGWLAREPNPEDRRSTRIWMTREGEDRLSALLPGHFANVAEVMSGLSPSEQATLADLLGKLRLHLETRSRDGSASATGNDRVQAPGVPAQHDHARPEGRGNDHGDQR